jgi:hypothetical protein
MSRLLLAKLALAEVSAQQLRTLLSETLMPNFYAHANSRAGRERNDHTLRRALGANRYADLVRWARTREFYVEESPLGGIVEWPPLLAKVYALAPDPSDELRWRCIRADHADRISNAVHAALAPVRPGA